MGQDQSSAYKESQAFRFKKNQYHHHTRYASQPPSGSMSHNARGSPELPPYSPVDPVSMGEMHRGVSMRDRGGYQEAALPAIPQGAEPLSGSMRNGTLRGQHARNSTASYATPMGSPPPPPPRQSMIINNNPAANRQSTLSASSSTRRAQEDLLRQLNKFDTVIVVDDSSSMAGMLWWEAKEALVQLAELAAKYDTDGIDIHFLNSTIRGEGLRAADVKRLFEQVEPEGITPTGEKLEELLLDYLLRLEQAKAAADRGDPSLLQQVKPVNFLVITDGAPSDDPETVIVTAARRLDAGRFPTSQVGIQFVQIGDDPDATEALRELDDDLAGRHGCRDIVDTTPFSGAHLDGNTLSKILLGGINKRVDKRGVS